MGPATFNQVGDSATILTAALTDPQPDAAWRSRLDRILADVAVDLVRTRVDDLDQAIVAALGAVAEHIGAERAAVFRHPLPLRLGEPTRPRDAGTRPDHLWPAAALSSTGPADPAVETVRVPVRSDGDVVGALRFELPAGRYAADTLATLIEPLGTLVAGALARGEQVTDRREAQTLRGLFDSVGDVISRIGPDGNTIYTNRAWTELTGVPVEETVGKNCLEQVHPEDRHIATEHLASGLDGTDPGMREVRMLAADGGVRWMEARGQAIFDPDGTFAGFAGAMHDVTERREAEAATRAAKAEAERARDEAEAARDEAERASRAKSEFLSRVSHELRTPLNAILGFSQLLEFAELPPEEAENAAFINNAGQHLLSLINDVLDVARVDCERLPLDVQPMSVSQIVSQSLDLVRTAATTRAVTLRFTDQDAAEATVLVDRRRSVQIVVNLLSNAIKYNREGGNVHVACNRITAAGSDPGTARRPMVRISVTDTGVGIPADRLSDAFLPFERLGAEVSDVEGAGVGLALAKSLAEAMGATLGVESVVGVGSTFHVDLPEAPGRVDDPARRVRSAGRSVRQAGRPERTSTVLYIEDNLSNIALMRRVFGYRPQVRLLVATDGATGRQMVCEQRPDLVLLDLWLPEMGGADVLAAIRADEDPAVRELPVVMITADAAPGIEERLLAAGANTFFGKPLEVKPFLATVDAILGTHPARPAGQPDPAHPAGPAGADGG